MGNPPRSPSNVVCEAELDAGLMRTQANYPIRKPTTISLDSGLDHDWPTLLLRSPHSGYDNKVDDTLCSKSLVAPHGWN